MTEKKLDIKEMVGSGKKARLERYQSGSLHYITECGFRFEVPVAELGTAETLPEERAMTLMKWIKRAIIIVEAAQTDVTDERNYDDPRYDDPRYDE